MNVRAIIYILGWILNMEGVFLLLPFLVSLIYHEPQGMAFLFVALLCILIGMIMILKKPRNMVFYEKVYRREKKKSTVIFKKTGFHTRFYRLLLAFWEDFCYTDNST